MNTTLISSYKDLESELTLQILSHDDNTSTLIITKGDDRITITSKNKQIKQFLENTLQIFEISSSNATIKQGAAFVMPCVHLNNSDNFMYCSLKRREITGDECSECQPFKVKSKAPKKRPQGQPYQ